MDPARIEKFQAQDQYLQERCPETLVLTYAMHWPDASVRPRAPKANPVYHALKAKGASMGKCKAGSVLVGLPLTGLNRSMITPLVGQAGLTMRAPNKGGTRDCGDDRLFYAWQTHG